MASINLLPWRDERREELKKEFIVTLVVFAIAAGLIIFIWYSLSTSALNNQNARNALLQSRIDVLSQQVAEISELQLRRKALESRMAVIQSLQGNRPEIVHVFDQLVRTLPDGVYYDLIKRKGSVLTLEGVAESSNRVSSLMRQLDKSPWLTDPNLRAVTSNSEFGEQANNFSMTVSLISPEEKK